ncbi:5,10-methylenetetrahydrofolate reductase [Ruminiclostridium hungatei]|uniref:Methylenetetrahydrofolate reductase n=1 Tax=Ruminiclostridium hungatei TaxID=48256 RepID=A0A1V4SLU5_RUMHU|nr:methylenetetrahydrofolate reductase [NAD(P)H] [Ruminiclostridium hungatei]OPX44455.1 5,10-methylenetetrahydrofolate reductase [Ruminiclostridium hungatei]
MIKNIYDQKKTVFSLEVFPPKNDVDIPAIYEALDQFKQLNLDFISITYGAGGGTRKRTLDIASYVQNRCNMDALAHLTCVSLDEELLSKLTEEFGKNNINNILALRGDRPKDMPDSVYLSRPYKYASHLVSLLRANPHMCVGGACYPEIHPESGSQEADLHYLKAKVEAGTDFLITQLFFDNTRFYRFFEKIRSTGISVPVSAGIMPITSINQIKTIVELSGANIPQDLSEIFVKYEDSPEDFKKAGIEYAARQISQLLSYGVQGVHLYTLNKVDVSTAIFENLGLL